MNKKMSFGFAFGLVVLLTAIFVFFTGPGADYDFWQLSSNYADIPSDFRDLIGNLAMMKQGTTGKMTYEVTYDTIENRFEYWNGSAYVRMPFATMEINSGLIVDTSTLHVNGTTNRVGIGTASPMSKTHIVNADTVYNGVSGSQMLVLSNTQTNGDASLYIGSDNTAHIAFVQAAAYAISYDYTLALNPTAGKVGIGTITPSTALHVASDNTSGIQLAISGKTNTNERLYMGYDTDGDHGLIGAFEETVGAKSLAINPSGGKVGIGTVAPLSLLSVSGEVRINQPGTATATAIGITSAGVVSFISSSERFKKDIEPAKVNVANLYKLQAKNYKFKGENIPHIGLIAEDVAKQFPLATQYSADGKIQSFDDKAMIAIMIEAMKEQQKRIEELEKKVGK